uniref:Ig-like domain-containing protein n=1 Tax=Nothobranchius pienaari TaxID=704102 RepID=A0A1A8M8F7_9TELE
MDLLLLLTSALLCSCGPVNTESVFQIASVTLSIEPRAAVRRNTNVTLRCQASVISLAQLNREYTLYKDNSVIYNKNTSSKEDFLYHLPEARVSNNGRYKCMVRILGQEMTSKSEKLTVTGMSPPILHADKSRTTEGEDVTVRCLAPGETGSFFFYFYDNSSEIHDEHRNTNQAEIKHHLSDVGAHMIHCIYKVFIMSESVTSDESNTVIVTVEELSIKPFLEISPVNNIYEGDNLTIKCSSLGFNQSHKGMNLLLNQGTNLLSVGNATAAIEYNMMVEATAPTLSFDCRLTVKNLIKVDTKTISVTELFSVPQLVMSPPQVFQMKPMTLICKSQHVALERVNKEDLTYSLDPAEHFLTPNGAGIFSGRALKNEFNYTCIAEAKGIRKRSGTLTINPKVPVSVPSIRVADEPILGESFRIFCQSSKGSGPITYSFWKGKTQIGTPIIKSFGQSAYISVVINDVKEINLFTCKANNGGEEDQQSAALVTAVTEPITNPILTVIPDPVEGNDLYLICSVQGGSPPVTFRWFRHDKETPLKVTTSHYNNSNYQITGLSKEYSGMYYCEADNRANFKVQSDLVDIEVRMALWKKALIGGVLLLVASLLIMISCVLYYKHRRVTLSSAVGSVWSERKPEADIDEEFSTVSIEPEVEYTEVVHPRSADPDRAPQKKGTETVYTELQNSPHGAVDHHDYGSVKYAELNGEQPETSQYRAGVDDYSDLPVPVD